MEENQEKPRPLILPDNILKQIEFWCREQNLGMFILGGRKVHAVIIGSNEDNNHPDEVAIVVAHMLLAGVIDGQFRGDNEQMIAAEQAIQGPKH